MDESDPSAPLKLDSCFRLHVQSLGKLLPNLSYSFKPLAIKQWILEICN